MPSNRSLNKWAKSIVKGESGISNEVSLTPDSAGFYGVKCMRRKKRVAAWKNSLYANIYRNCSLLELQSLYKETFEANITTQP